MADNISEDFTDLTVDDSIEESAEEEYKPVKTPKAPKAPKAPREPSAAIEVKAGKVKKKGRKLKIILIIVLIVLVAGFVFEETYFNYLGLRTMLFDAVVMLDPDYRMREETLNKRESELNALKAELDAREKTITSRESQNDRRSADLQRQSDEIRDREAWLTPLYRRQMSEQEQEDMASISLSYSRMSPENAASILLELNKPEDVAAILYFMSERNAAAILAVMEPEFAARITEIWLYN